MTSLEIKNELANLSSNFTDKSFDVRCWDRDSKDKAVEILRQYYEIVEPSDGRGSSSEKMSWYISCANPILTESLLCEDDFDTEDDFDMEDWNLDTLEDSDDVDVADSITILKKRASVYAEKWLDAFTQISRLASKINLTATHNDDLEIELHKLDGTKSNYEDDVEFMDNLDKIDATKDDEADENVDDDFGPSEYDDRANQLPPDEEETQVESFQSNVPKTQITESKYPWNPNNGTIEFNSGADPNEIPLSIEDVDDDF